MKKGFKQTEIGLIPEDWEVKELENIAEVLTGPFGAQLHASDYVEVGTPIITVEHLSELGIIHINLPRVSDSDKERLKKYILKVDDIVFSRVGSVDRNSLVREAENGWLFSGRLLRVRPKKEIRSAFLSFYFHYEPFKHRIRSISVGQTMASLNTALLNSVTIPLPPLPEQKKIAEILSTWDNGIEKIESLIALKEKRKKGLMQLLLTGKKRLSIDKGKVKIFKFKETKIGKIPEDWEVVRIVQIVAEEKYAIVDGPFGSNLKSIHYRSEGIPIIQSGFVTSNKYKVTEYQYVDKELFREQIRSKAVAGDIIVAKIGANAGTSAILPEGHPDSIIAGNCLKITVNKKIIINKYLLSILHLEYEKDQLISFKSITAQPAINLKSLKEFPLPLPPLAEQKRIAEVLSSADKEIELHKEELEKLKTQKKGLMQKLLTGKVRVLTGGKV